MTHALGCFAAKLLLNKGIKTCFFCLLPRTMSKRKGPSDDNINGEIVDFLMG